MKKGFCLTIALLTFGCAPSVDAQDARGCTKHTEWSAPVNLAPTINSTHNDLAASLSKDGRSLYFTSSRPGFGGEDIWVSQRTTRRSEWGTPVNLGPTINSYANERVRSLSPDGRLLLIQSDRVDGIGGNDIWVSTRRRINDAHAWTEPINAGAEINTSSNELGATFLLGNQGMNHKLYFASSRIGGFGGSDFYSSEIGVRNVFESPVNLVELNSVFNETCSSIQGDGLEIIFTSTRPDPNNAPSSNDLWISTRTTVFDSWSPPINLGSTVNVEGAVDAHPALSYDGTTLVFTSNRAGGQGGMDLYVATREKCGGR